jgi:hypothetical protein
MIINQNFKNTYKYLINDILSSSGLTNECILQFASLEDYCNNCLFDRSSLVSANIYNGSGPYPFEDYSTCPVCLGAGKVILSNNIKKLFLAVILDSKYFINLNNKLIDIPEGSIQIITNKQNINDLKSCTYLSLVSNPHIKYERVDDINLAGLGDLDYIFMNWRRV